MTNLVKCFGQDESGAATVDYVILTGAIVALVLGIVSVFPAPVTDRMNEITELMATAR